MMHNSTNVETAVTDILVNGEPKRVLKNKTVMSLIEELGLTGKRIAVECNQEIVPKSEYENTALSEGDVIEIVQAIGGG